MIRFTNLSLRNFILFQNAELDLDYEGVTVVTGKNEDNKMLGAAGSNASGKSLLLRSIPSILYGSSPVITENKRSHKKAHMTDGTRAVLSFSTDDEVVDIRKEMKSSKIVYSFKRSDQIETPRTQAIAEEMLEETFPLTEEEFYATVYLDRDRPNILQFGTPAKKFQAISDLFNLDVYDEVRVYLNSKALEMRSAQSKLDNLQGLIEDKKDSIRRELDGKSVKEIKSKIEGQKREVKRLRKKLRSIPKVRDGHGDMIKLTRKVLKTLGDASLGETIKDMEKKLQKQQAVTRDLQQMEYRYPNLGEIERRLGVPSRSEKEIMDLSIGHRSKIESLSEKITHLAKHVKDKTTKCIVCGSDMTVKDAKRLMTKADKDKATLSKELRALNKELAEARFKDQHKDVPGKIKALQSKASKVDVPRLARKIEVFKKAEAFLEEYGTLEEAESALKDASAFRDLDAALEMETRSLMRDWKRVTALTTHKKDLDSLKKRKETEAEKVGDLPVIKMLSQTFSNKGIKKLIVRDLIGRVERNMNEHASSLIPGFSFNWQVAETSGLSISANRRVEGKSITSDVTALSGAESRCFGLLLLVGMLPVLPGRRRSNMLVLDEQSSGMDDIMIERLVSNFIPTLNEVVDHVVYITPDLDESRWPEGRVLTVRRSGGVSALSMMEEA